MKRCNVCGNVGEDSSTFCEACGAPYADAEAAAPQEAPVTQKVADAENVVVESIIEEIAEPEKQVEKAKKEEEVPAESSAAPQIYGQGAAAPNGQEYAQQGMIRRNVQGRPANQQGMQNRPMNGQMQGRPMNGQMQGRPMNGQMQGRPMNGQMPGRPQQQGMQGRPMNAQMQGRPMNGQMQGRPMNGQMQGRMMMAPAQRSQKIMETSRKLMRSPLFFLIALLHTAYLGGTIASIFLNQMNYSQAARLLQNVSIPPQFAGYTDTIMNILAKMDSGMVVANVALQIPTLLFCLGLWIIFLSALTAKDRMSGLGFTLAKIDIIISMIGAFILMLGTLILTVAIVVSAWVSKNTVMMIVAAIALVIVIVIVMMVIMYYFSFLASLKTCRLNGDMGESYGRVSSYVAVMHIIFALVSIVSLLSAIVNNELAGIVAAVGAIGWMVLFGIWMLKYRGKMEEYQEQ